MHISNLTEAKKLHDRRAEILNALKLLEDWSSHEGEKEYHLSVVGIRGHSDAIERYKIPVLKSQMKEWLTTLKDEVEARLKGFGITVE